MRYTLELERNQKVYTIAGISRYNLNKALGYGLFKTGNPGPYKLDDEDWRIISKKYAEFIQSGDSNSTDWHSHPVTDKQLEYLATLQVAIPDGYNLTKGRASSIINAVKNGDGIGQFGLSFLDGSN